MTIDYGYYVHRVFSDWAPLDCEVRRFASRALGILGEFTEVVNLSKG